MEKLCVRIPCPNPSETRTLLESNFPYRWQSQYLVLCRSSLLHLHICELSGALLLVKLKHKLTSVSGLLSELC
jgi:hypothetical protein